MIVLYTHTSKFPSCRRWAGLYVGASSSSQFSSHGISLFSTGRMFSGREVDPTTNIQILFILIYGNGGGGIKSIYVFILFYLQCCSGVVCFYLFLAEGEQGAFDREVVCYNIKHISSRSKVWVVQITLYKTLVLSLVGRTWKICTTLSSLKLPAWTDDQNCGLYH